MKRVALILLVAFMSLEGKAAPTSITVSNQSVLVAGHVILPTNSGPSMMVDTVTYSFDPTFTIHSFNGSSWSLGRPAAAAGYGYVIFSTNATLTLPENSPTNLPLSLPAGYSVISCQSNVPATFEMMVGRPPDVGTKLYRLLPKDSPLPPITSDWATNYTIYVFGGNGWIPETPIADIGEAVWVFQPPVISNPHMDANGFSFGALTGWGADTEVLYTDSLLSSNWLVLTNISVGSFGGGVSNVIDSTGVTTNRFYRLNMPAVVR